MTTAIASAFTVSLEPTSEGHAPGAFEASMARFAPVSGPSLLGRIEPFFAWQSARRRAGVWPFSRSLDGAPRTSAAIKTEDGQAHVGLNFASQDYLGLSADPRVSQAVTRALRDFGPHSAGSPMLVGNTALSLALEAALADFLAMPEVLLFPTGWAAGFGAITGLVRSRDHIVIDRLAHACLQQGAAAATRNVVKHDHLDVDAAIARVAAIRAQDRDNSILVVTEGLYSMDADVPELVRLQEACTALGATLLVDVAHDLGAMGPGGTGSIGAQGLLGKVDLVMGSFSKTFASNGGFVATRSAAVKQYLKCYGGPHIFSNALSPLQAAAVLAALQVVRSPEGELRRKRMLSAASALRAGLAERGVRCYGVPSPIVPAALPDSRRARLASAILTRKGLFANLVEYPAVPVGAPRFRLQMMATHTAAQAQLAARIVADAINECE